jgi:hypothetical protein
MFFLPVESSKSIIAIATEKFRHESPQVIYHLHTISLLVAHDIFIDWSKIKGRVRRISKQCRHQQVPAMEDLGVHQIPHSNNRN